MIEAVIDLRILTSVNSSAVRKVVEAPCNALMRRNLGSKTNGKQRKNQREDIENILERKARANHPEVKNEKTESMETLTSAYNRVVRTVVEDIPNVLRKKAAECLRNVTNSKGWQNQRGVIENISKGRKQQTNHPKINPGKSGKMRVLNTVR